MRLATWNINGMNARREYLLHWLRDVQPDVVGLQETKISDEQFQVAVFEDLGYHCSFHGQKGWNGVAILSRSPGHVTQIGLPGQEDSGARLLTVQVEGISLSSLYCPNGKSLGHENFARKLSWLDSLIEHIAAQHRPEDPVVLGGDFNVVPTALDTWNEQALRGELFHTDAERSRIQRLVDWGFVDIFRDRHPDEHGFTWWDYRAGAFHKQQGLRIDLVLATHPVAQRVTAIEIERRWRKKVDGLIPSDHAPVWFDLAGS